jgi:hypothetical protein
MMIICEECGYGAVNNSGLCLSCGHKYEPEPEANAVIVFLVLALCVGGIIWSVFKYMILN